MKSLFLAWQDKSQSRLGEAASRRWFPIGRLDCLEEGKLFRFQYTHGANDAKQLAGFSSLDSFPNLNVVYKSHELFPLFKNRVPSSKREDFADFVQRLGIKNKMPDPFEILAVSGGGRQTDNLEVFPKIEKRQDGSFACRFFLHGWRHTNEAATKRLMSLQPEEILRVAVELNNPASGTAIQLSSTDYYMLGWAPRYLINDTLEAISTASANLVARVIQLNPAPAPYNQRVLIELTGKMAPNVEPMSGTAFQPLNLD